MRNSMNWRSIWVVKLLDGMSEERFEPHSVWLTIFYDDYHKYGWTLMAVGNVFARSQYHASVFEAYLHACGNIWEPLILKYGDAMIDKYDESIENVLYGSV